ncbi:MAG: hypothetical protein AAGA29_13755 [Planctomycetota bacterium]
MPAPLPLAELIDGKWYPSIGDPSVYGWSTVIAYLWAALLCMVCARWSKRLYAGPGPKRFAAFWGVLALGLAFMAINKQLDLQQLGGVWARQLAHAQGWYEDRRTYQRGFILASGTLGIVCVVGMLVVLRHMLNKTWLAILGLGLTLAFALSRAASFHHVDQLLGVRLGGVAINWLIEWSGILLITAGALTNLLAKPTDSGTDRPPRMPISPP